MLLLMLSPTRRMYIAVLEQRPSNRTTGTKEINQPIWRLILPVSEPQYNSELGSTTLILSNFSAFLYAIRSRSSFPTNPLPCNSSIHLKPFSFFANG